MNCVFCELSKGNGKCYKVYEDESVFAFLDKHPINPGHVLVIPKKHIGDFYELEDEQYSMVMLAVKKIAKTINTVIGPKKVGMLAAGFDIDHAHIHLVPMYEYHDLTSKSLLEGNRANPSDEELVGIANKLLV